MGDEPFTVGAVPMKTASNLIVYAAHIHCIKCVRDRLPDLFVRTKSLSDGAIPAATSIMLADLVALSEITRESRFLSDAMATLDSESQFIKSSPLGAVVSTQQLQKLLVSHPEKFDEPFEITMANPSPVRMSTDPEMMNIKAGEEGELVLKLRMAAGWHVNSNNPEYEYAIPISFQSLTEGVVITPQWPAGERLISAGEEVNVFGDVVEIHRICYGDVDG